MIVNVDDGAMVGLDVVVVLFVVEVVYEYSVVGVMMKVGIGRLLSGWLVVWCGWLGEVAVGLVWV